MFKKLYVIVSMIVLPVQILAADLTKHQMFEVQTKLSLLGFDAGKPDGIFGRKTRAAYNDFANEFQVKSAQKLSTNELKVLRDVFLDEPARVFEGLTDDTFQKSGLAELSIPKNYKFFVDNDRLVNFHAAYGFIVDDSATLTNTASQDLPEYFDDCARAIGEFDTSWNKFELQERFKRCLDTYSHRHFNDIKQGARVLEKILLDWSKLKPVIHRGRTDVDIRYQGYGSSMTLASIAHLYAVYYDFFEFSSAERSAVDQYLKNWLITEDLFINVGRTKCKTQNSSADFANPRSKTDTDYCGSNRLRMALGAIYLGLRLNDNLLFKAGNRHLAIALNAVDEDGVYMPWAKKGALALSYQRQLPEVLTFFADAYESIGFDFYEHKVPSGVKIHQMYEHLFKFIDAPEILKKYASAEPNFGGSKVGINYYDFMKKSLKEHQEHEMIYHDVLSVASADYMKRYQDGGDQHKIIDSWQQHWPDYIALFVMPSGVAVNYAKAVRANGINNEFIMLPRDYLDRARATEKEYGCRFQVKRVLNNEVNVLGEGYLRSEDKQASVFNFEWFSSADTDYIELNSTFIIEDDGTIEGVFPINTMIGDDQSELVHFGDDFKSERPGYPVGRHNSQINGMKVFLEVLACRDI